jgi:hypothetical protein
MKNVVLWDVTLCGFCRTDVSEVLSASMNSVTFCELGITLD